nr:Hypothetical protein [Aeromonas sp.]
MYLLQIAGFRLRLLYLMADISNLLGSFSLWLFKRITFFNGAAYFER